MIIYDLGQIIWISIYRDFGIVRQGNRINVIITIQEE